MAGGHNLMISLSCDIPGTIEMMNINSDSDVLEMFSLHRRSRYINVYVQQLNGNIPPHVNDNTGNGNNQEGNENNMGLNAMNIGAVLGNDGENINND